MAQETINAIIVDDEPRCIEQLRQCLCAFPCVSIVGELTDGAGLMTTLENSNVDLVFLDIRIQEESGFTLSELIRREFPNKMIVFTTGFEDFAVQGYEHEPLDFLPKPVDIKRLGQTLERAQRRLKTMAVTDQAKIGVHLSSGFRFIAVDRILKIERTDRRVLMTCSGGGGTEVYTVRESMAELEKIFGTYDFMRVHQSFIVPVRRITGVRKAEIGCDYVLEIKELAGVVPVSRGKYREILQRLSGRGDKLI